VSTDCIFCKIVSDDLPAERVAESERALAFMDVNPGSRGHLLVIPKVHADDLHSISPEDLTACTLLAQEMADRVRERLDCDGVNLINSCGSSAWQTVFHFHMHVVPRYRDDTLRLPWMPGDGCSEDSIGVVAELLR